MGLWRRRHKIPQNTTTSMTWVGAWWGPCQSPCRVSLMSNSPFIGRRELLTLVPHSMSTIDRLEAKGQFPKRIRLEPTNRVGWLRSEVTAYLRRLAKRRRPAAQEDQVEAVNQELVARSKESGPTPQLGARQAAR